MIVLSATTQILQLVLSAGTADVEVAYVDRTATTFPVGGTQETAATAATQTIAAAPAASTSREIASISVAIKTTGGNVTIQKFNSSGSVTTQLTGVITLAVNDTLTYTHSGDSWSVLDGSGNKKQIMPSYLQLTGGTVSGATIFQSTITPSQTLGIVGTTTNNTVQAGSIGEFISAQVTSASAFGITTATSTDITSISLTAGEWDVYGSVALTPAGTTIVSQVVGWINTVSASIPTNTAQGGIFVNNATQTAGANFINPFGRRQELLASTTTIYLGINATFTISTCSAYGFIAARRVR